MSGGLIVQRVLRELSRAKFPAEATTPAVRAVEKMLSRGQLPEFLYRAGIEVGLSEGEVEQRGAAVLMLYCGAHVVDDIIDDEDLYVDNRKMSPAIATVLLTLGTAVVVESSCRAADVAAAMRSYALAAARMATEVSIDTWTAARYQQVGEAISGLQFQGHLRLLWGDKHPSADEVGKAVGVATHVAEDIRSKDPRFVSMPPADRTSVISWGRASVERLYRVGLPSLASIAARCDDTLSCAE